MAGNGLLNRAAVRRYILDYAARARHGWKPTRVSTEALDRLEAELRARIRGYVQGHRSAGKTFNP